MAEVSTTTPEFLNITIIKSDRSVTTVPAPADPTQKTAYWLPRRALLSFLHSRIDENVKYRDAITFHYGTTIEGLSLPENLQSMDAEACVRVRCMDGTIVKYATTKVLGCDGMNSKIRTGLAAWAIEDGEWHIQS
jgi:2-polyprenyl-6-methoxyphenol hydroxylase-like FAD-dependent oxidoreductase